MAPRIKPGGVAYEFTPTGMVEAMTSTCAHCQHVTHIPSLRKMMECVEICRSCMKLICLEHCAGKPCTPFMKKVEAMEAEYYKRVQFRKALGVD